MKIVDKHCRGFISIKSLVDMIVEPDEIGFDTGLVATGPSLARFRPASLFVEMHATSQLFERSSVWISRMKRGQRRPQEDEEPPPMD
jgi:hypothetical protein